MLRSQVREEIFKIMFRYPFVEEGEMEEQVSFSLEDLEGSGRLICAYDYFRENIKVDKLDYYAIINNVLLVSIDLNNDEDEQQIFDTINSLGVLKSTPASSLCACTGSNAPSSNLTLIFFSFQVSFCETRTVVTLLLIYAI